ncbi:MAG: GFA family protein [Sphingomonas sp.]
MSEAMRETAREEVTGGCQCGRVRYRVAIHNDDAYLCHCRMCQRATGGVYIAFKNVKKADVSWEREPDQYASSPIASRGFCAACGTPLTFAFPDSVNIDLTVGSFDAPERFVPRSHFGVESIHEAWQHTDDLPRTRCDEHQPLNDRWLKTTGKIPE